MKKIISLLFIFILTIITSMFFIFSSNSISADALRDDKGYTVSYPNSSTVITVPSSYTKVSTEFRAAWVSFFAGDIKSYSDKDQMKKQLTEVLNTLEEYNMNAIIFHIRTHNNACYETDLAPQALYTKDVNYEEFDYLEWFINECHKRGIEFHAWLNPYRIAYGTTMETILSDYANYEVNPAHYKQNILMNSDGDAILDPGRPDVQDYIVNVCMEVIEKYDVDAIHFDDYFYISDVDDSETRKLYNTDNLSIGDFRRKSVDDFIYKLSTSMYNYNIKNNRSVQLGISPSAIYQNIGLNYVSPNSYKWDSDGNLVYPVGSCSRGYAHYDSPLYCDTKKWIDNEWIDYIVPQVYNGFDIEAACYASVVEWWNAVVKNKKVNLYIGTGLYKKGYPTSGGFWYTSENEWYNQLLFNQKNTYVKGTSVYQYKSIIKYEDTECVKKVKDNCYTNTTKLPTLLRYQNQYDLTKSVSNLRLYKKDNKVALVWDKLSNVKNYLIYQYYDTLDLNDASLIVGMSGNDTSKDYCVFNLDYSSTKGEKFAIVPVSNSNELMKESIININNASSFSDKEYEVAHFNSYYVTGTVSGGQKLNLRFDEAEAVFGSNISYEVYMVNGRTWDEENKQKVEVTKLNSTYLSTFIMPKAGTPVVLRILAKTEFGSIYSDDILVNIRYTSPLTTFKDVFNNLNNMINNLYGE